MPATGQTWVHAYCVGMYGLMLPPAKSRVAGEYSKRLERMAVGLIKCCEDT